MIRILISLGLGITMIVLMILGYEIAGLITGGVILLLFVVQILVNIAIWVTNYIKTRP